MLNRPIPDIHYFRQRRAVWIGLGAAIALDTAAQVCWKASTFPASGSATIFQTLTITFRQPLFFITVLLFILMFFNWMAVLSKADLSYAQPITALGYVSVSVIAAIWFHEDIPVHRMAGIVMIISGVWFISGTSHRTVTGNAQSPSKTKRCEGQP
ncbi:MAG: EamA family transporter [Proteobacteria bacterium]|nr:EamA family transporter [Pseudomonadota bacterium]